MDDSDKLKAAHDYIDVLFKRRDEALERSNSWTHTCVTSALADNRKLQARLDKAVEALEKLDEWQGKQGCNASVYEIEDDEFGHMQLLIHEALKLIKGDGE